MTMRKRWRGRCLRGFKYWRQHQAAATNSASSHGCWQCRTWLAASCWNSLMLVVTGGYSSMLDASPRFHGSRDTGSGDSIQLTQTCSTGTHGMFELSLTGHRGFTRHKYLARTRSPWQLPTNPVPPELGRDSSRLPLSCHTPIPGCRFAVPCSRGLQTAPYEIRCAI